MPPAGKKRGRDASTPASSGLDEWTMGATLGEGAFATVRLATPKKGNGLPVACKFINKGLTDEAQAKHEISILKALGSHPNVVCLVDTFETPAAYAVLLEYVAGGEVFDKLADNGPFSEKDAAKIVRECAMALRHMHKLGIVHRDLKPENLLLTKDTNDVKVADFGLAAFFGNGHEPLTQACGTITYLAPEMISAQQTGGSYGAGVDLWSLGAILFSLLGAYAAFDPLCNLSDDEIEERIQAGSWDFNAYPKQWEHVSEAAKSTIRSLLSADPKKRPTAAKLLDQSAWVKGDSAPAVPLPASDVSLKAFQEGRQLWRAAIDAAALFIGSPDAATAAVQQSGATQSGGFCSNAAAKAKHALGGWLQRGIDVIETATGVDIDGDGKVSSASKGAKKSSSSSSSSSSVVSLPESAEAELRRAFNVYDKDGSGEIDADELRDVMKGLGFVGPDVARRMAEIDTNGDGVISYEEFKQMLLPIYQVSGEALRRIFDFFDADGNGSLEKRELEVMLQKLGMGAEGGRNSARKKMLDNVFEAADTNHDGVVSFEEFVALFKASSALN